MDHVHCATNKGGTMPSDVEKLVTKEEKEKQKKAERWKEIAKIALPFLLGFGGTNAYNHNQITDLQGTVGNLNFAIKIYSGEVQPGTPVEEKK